MISKLKLALNVAQQAYQVSLESSFSLSLRYLIHCFSILHKPRGPLLRGPHQPRALLHTSPRRKETNMQTLQLPHRGRDPSSMAPISFPWGTWEIVSLSVPRLQMPWHLLQELCGWWAWKMWAENVHCLSHTRTDCIHFLDGLQQANKVGNITLSTLQAGRLRGRMSS